MIKINNLSINYKGTGKNVFKDVSFKVEKGEIVVLLGPSGCGKTTLLNHISSLASDTKVSGTIEIGEKNDKKPKVRIVFQSPTLLPWRTLERNIALGLEGGGLNKDSIEKKVSEAIAMVGLNGYEKYYPAKLSVGMQQRVNFARALVCDPDILLLDEPFSALDVNRRKKIQKDFLEIIRKRKMTAIFVTHSIEEALEIGDKIYVFFDGKNVKKGFYENGFKNASKKELYINMKDYLYAC